MKNSTTVNAAQQPRPAPTCRQVPTLRFILVLIVAVCLFGCAEGTEEQCAGEICTSEQPDMTDAGDGSFSDTTMRDSLDSEEGDSAADAVGDSVADGELDTSDLDMTDGGTTDPLCQPGEQICNGECSQIPHGEPSCGACNATCGTVCGEDVCFALEWLHWIGDTEPPALHFSDAGNYAALYRTHADVLVAGQHLSKETLFLALHDKHGGLQDGFWLEGGGEFFQGSHDVLILPDGDIVLARVTETPLSVGDTNVDVPVDRRSQVLIRMSPTGVVRWQKVHTGPIAPQLQVEPRLGYSAHDDTLILVTTFENTDQLFGDGPTGSFNGRHIVKLSPKSGEVSWAKPGGGRNAGEAEESFWIQQNGNIGFLHDPPSGEAAFMQYSPSGGLMWELSLGDMEGATPSTDGGWYVAGTPETNLEGTYFPRLMKLDGNGEVVWTRDFPETHGMFTDVVVYDDGLWVAGWDRRTDDGSLDPSNPWPAGAGYLSRHSLDGNVTDVVPLSPSPWIYDLEVRGDALYFTAEGSYIQTEEGDIAGDGETTNVLTVKLTPQP